MTNIDQSDELRGLREITLDGRGLKYVRNQLLYNSVFCRALLRVFDEAPGYAVSYLPTDTSVERAHQFTHGGIWRDKNRFSAASYVTSHLAASEYAVCIVDDVVPRPTDRCLKIAPSNFFVGDQLNSLLTSAESVEVVDLAIRNGNYIWHGISAVCCPGFAYSVADLSSPDALIACIRSVTEILATAYDGEGFVIWRRNAPI